MTNIIMKLRKEILWSRVIFPSQTQVLETWRNVMFNALYFINNNNWNIYSFSLLFYINMVQYYPISINVVNEFGQK